MPRLKTIRAFGEWVKDDANVEALLRLMVEKGYTFQKACLMVKQPYTLVSLHLHSTQELQKRYEDARRLRANLLHDEKVVIADGVKNSKRVSHVMAAKLQCDVRDGEAKSWDPERFGPKLKVEKSVVVGMDQTLLKTAEELLRMIEAKTVKQLPQGQVSDAEIVSDGV